MVGELVDDREPDLVCQVVRVREVLLERQSEERDPVGHRRPVRAPLGPRDALVQAVQGLVGVDVVVAALVRRRFVIDHDRDLVESAGERLGDRREGVADQRLERAMA
jgi:hypothetical protein